MKLPELFPKLYNFILPSTVYEYPNCSTSLLALCVVDLLNFIHYGGIVVVFALHWTVAYVYSAPWKLVISYTPPSVLSLFFQCRRYGINVKWRQLNVLTPSFGNLKKKNNWSHRNVYSYIWPERSCIWIENYFLVLGVKLNKAVG